MNSVKRGNYYMLFLVIFNLLAQAAMVIYFTVRNDLSLVASPYFYIGTQLGLFGLPFLIFMLLSGEKITEVLPLRRPGFVNVVYVLAMCISMSPAMMLVSAFTSLFFDNAAAMVFDEFSRYPIAVTIFAVCVMPAVFEEINFRGIILTNYGKMSTKKAVLINGLFFGLIHFNLQQFLYAFLIGIVFSLFVRHTGSIVYSMIAHFFLNLSQVLLDALLVAEPAETEAVTPADLIPIAVLAAVGCVIFLILYINFVKRNKEPERLEA